MKNDEVRPSAVAGTFYPDSPMELIREVDRLTKRRTHPLVDDANEGTGELAPSSGTPRTPAALVVPHAGYVYSGAVAGVGYARVAAARQVVILGPSHRVALRGVGLSSASAFATPLGNIALDVELAVRLHDALPGLVDWHDDAHAYEHSIEVHLPFLRRRCPRASLLPLVVGDCPPEDVETVLRHCDLGPDSLVVCSTDLSHYLAYEQARGADAATARAILALREDIEPEQACGARPLNGLLRYARHQGWRAECLDMRTSGDTAGTRDRVVGYGTWALYRA